MDEGKYMRQVPLLCPTCGCNDFEILEEGGDRPELVKCARCERTLTRDDLLELNSENIHGHLEELGKAVVDDLQKELKDGF